MKAKLREDDLSIEEVETLLDDKYKYQATILTLKAKIREDDLTIEAAETLLDDKYEAMKEVQGWTEDGMSLHYLLASHISRKHSLDNVDIVVNMVIKQLIVLKEKQT